MQTEDEKLIDETLLELPEESWIDKEEYKLVHKGENMTTGNESPQSISFTGYYKGFSVVVTKRDEEAKVQPLIVQAKEAIDYMLEQGFLPSWNSETNKEVLQTKTTVVSQPTTSQPTVGACPKCNSPLVEAKKKDGSIYYKCSTNKWDKMRKVATGCDYVDWNN